MREAGAQITVLNFFTRSAYAPYAADIANVSAVRASEDRKCLRAIDPAIRIRSLNLLDAPLRLPIDFGSITNPAVFNPVDEEVSALSRVIRAVCWCSLVLCPLGLGDHIDHRTIREAAIAALRPSALAFYEDLPYAGWTAESEIRERVNRLEQQISIRLRPVHQGSNGWRFKNRVVRQYHSQIDDAMAAFIARHSTKFGGAERIWVPRHSARWHLIL